MSGTVYLYESDMELAATFRYTEKPIDYSFLYQHRGYSTKFDIIEVYDERISSLLSSIRKCEEGDYTHKAKIKGRDEIAEIASEFNALTDRFERVENVRRQFVSDASHELKTPLASIKILADSITQTENMPPELVRDSLKISEKR